MIEENKNMMLNTIQSFDELLTTLPYTHHIVINEIHNVELRKRWALPLRKVDDYVLAFIRSGNGHYIIEGKIIPFKAGHIILIAPGTEFSADQSTLTPSLLSIRFSLITNDSKQPVRNEIPFYYHHISENIEVFRSLFHSAYSAYLSDQGTLSENAYICLILDALKKEAHTKSLTTAYDIRLESAKVYMQKNPSKAIAIKDLADIANLSLPYFSKKFKEQYGLTPKSYLFKMRMNYAKQLLCEYRYSVTEVADVLHYSDPFIFSNQYKKFWGQMPSKAKQL